MSPALADSTIGLDGILLLGNVLGGESSRITGE